MENQRIDQIQTEENKIEQESQTLEITGEITSQLNETGKWGKFLAILGFIFIGLFVALGFIVSIIMAFIPKGNFGGMPFPTFLFGFIYLILGALYFIPLLFLYRFSAGIRQALFSKNQKLLTKAFFNLKAHYRFIGILMIVFIVLYLLTIVIMIFAGLFAGISGFTGGMHA